MTCLSCGQTNGEHTSACSRPPLPKPPPATIDPVIGITTTTHGGW